MKKLLFILAITLVALSGYTADYYWVGQGVNKQWNTTGNWANASGGTSFYSVPPSAGDNVFFDLNSNPNGAGNSFTVELVSTSTGTTIWQCNNFNVSGTTGPLVITDKGATNVPLQINGSIVLQAGMTYSVNTTYLASSGVANITSNSVQFRSSQTQSPYGLYINNGGSYTFNDAFTATVPFHLQKGGLNTNNQLVSFKGFNSGATLPVTTTLTLGTSTVNITGNYESPYGWQHCWLYRGTGATLSAANSHINIIQNGAVLFTESNHVYNTVASTLPNISATIGGIGAKTTFNTINFSGSGSVSSVIANTITSVAEGSVNGVVTSSLTIGTNARGISNSSITTCSVAGNALIPGSGGSAVGSCTIVNCFIGGYSQKIDNSIITHCTIGASATINGGNVFRYLSIGDNGTFNGANKMDTLKFSAGKAYTFQAATTNTITAEWSAISPSCSGLLEIKSNTFGAQATINFMGTPTATLTNVIITDMKATGTYSPIGTGFDNGNNTNFTITNPVANNLYWIGGSGNWNDATHWSTVSGATYPSVTGCVPTPVDNVFFNAGSNLPANTGFTVTVDPNALPAYCHNMTWNGAPGSPLLTGSSLETPLNIYGSFTLQVGMTHKVNYTNCLSQTTGETITTNGVLLSNNGTYANDMGLYIKNGGSYSFTDNYNSAINVFLPKGGLNTNNNLFTIRGFSGGAVSPITTTLTLGTSTVNVTVGAWVYSGTGTTLSAALSHINLTNPGAQIFNASANHIYNTAIFTSTASAANMYLPDNVYFNQITCNGITSTANSIKGPWSPGVNTLKKVIIAGDASILDRNVIGYLSIGGNSGYGNSSGGPALLSVIDTLLYLTPSKEHTFKSGTTTTIRQVWSALGVDCAVMTKINSSTAGSQATISFSGTPTYTITNVMLTDMKAVGSVTPVTTTGLDLGNNSGFSVTSPSSKTLYWVGGSGNWNDKDHWSTINNGVYPSGINGCIPTRFDDVVFGPLSNTLTNTSFTTSISGVDAECHNITWSGAPGNPRLTDNRNGVPLSIYGSSVWQAGMTYFVVNTNYLSTTTETITANGITMTGTNTYGGTGLINISNGGSYLLADDFRTSCIVTLSKGGLNTNKKQVSMASFSGGATLPNTTTLTISKSTVTVTSNALLSGTTSWYYNGTGALLQADSSEVYAVGRFYSSPATHTFNNVYFTSGSIYGSNTTFNNIAFSGAGNLLSGGIKANVVTITGNGSVTGTHIIDSLMIGGTGAVTGTNTISHCEIVGVATITGTNTINYLSMKSNGFINGSNISDTLVFNTGATYILESAKTQTVTSRLYASGYSCAPITIRSSVAGSAANLRVLAGSTDYYYGRLTDINASALTFTYGIGSNNFGGNTNIVFDPSSSPFSAGLGSDLLLRCDQYPYTINTTNFAASPLASYSWSGTGGTGSGSTFLATGPGTYSVNVAYSIGCELADAVTLTQTTLQPVSASVTNTLICSGNTSTLQASGVSTYTWSNGATTANTVVSPTTTSVYTITATDSNGCIDTKTVSVDVNTSPVISIASVTSPSICSGNSTIITPNGASTYTLLNSGLAASSFTVSPTTTTTYSIVGTSSQNCTGVNTATTTIIVNASPTISSSTQTNVLCFGGTTGSASITATGGLPNYTYSWSPSVSSTTNAASSLSFGTYTATVTDANNCTATKTISITQPTAISLASNNTSSVTCFGASTGSLSLTPTGGMPVYTYSWTGSSSTTNAATSLAAGNYTATVTDANLCTTTQTFTITQPASAVSIASSNTSSVACFGASTGSLSLTATGGTPVYTYSWTGSSSTNNSATGLAAGNYTATVRDANLCTTTQTFTITEPASAVSIASTITSSAVCFGSSTGSATVNVTGGTSAYTYSWTGNTSTTNSATSLAAGNYTATVTDANLCTTTQSFVITEPTAIVANVTATTQAGCGLSNGSATITATGGSPAYTYSWTPPAPAPSFTTTTAETNTLAAGITQVLTTDANGCVTPLFITITNPNAPVITPTQTNVLCYGNATGIAEASITNGTAPYTYSWSPSVGSSTNTASSLTSGNYILSVVDVANCTAGYVFNITQPSAPLTVATITTNSILCYGDATGSASITVNGGTSAYTYTWLPTGGNNTTSTGLTAQEYTVNIMDANNCGLTQTVSILQPTAALSVSAITTQSVLCYGTSTGSVTVDVIGGTSAYTYTWLPTGGNNNIATGLTAQEYTVNILDANNCALTQTLSITEPTAALVASITNTTQAGCGLSNGQATLSVLGGAPVYTYTWVTPATSYTTNAQVTYSLSAGVNQVFVSDINGCTTNTTVLITNPNSPTVVAIASDVSCYGASTGSITTNVSGGNAYTYTWSTGEQTAAIINLPSGVYTVTVKDGNNCSSIQTATINEPSSPVSLTISNIVSVSCYGNQTGAADVIATGGTPGYTYNWLPGNTSTQNLTNVAAGVYTIVVSDSKSCNTQSIVTVAGPTTQLSTSIIASESATCEQSNGSVKVLSNGGTPNYTYQWNTGIQGNELLNVLAGNYTVVTTDANGCSDTLNVILSCELDLLIPQIFSPNGDGKNDKFEIKAIGDYPNNTLQIFNRWGSLVYSKNNYNNEWDGKPNINTALGNALLPAGTYYVVVDFGDDKTKPYKGFVQLEY